MDKLFSIELFDADDVSIFYCELIRTFSISESFLFCIDTDNVTHRFPMSVIGMIKIEVE